MDGKRRSAGQGAQAKRFRDRAVSALARSLPRNNRDAVRAVGPALRNSARGSRASPAGACGGAFDPRTVRVTDTDAARDKAAHAQPGLLAPICKCGVTPKGVRSAS